MPDPLSWQTVEALATAYTVVTTANGYHTDLGSNIVTEREQAGDAVARLSIGVSRMRWASLAYRLREHLLECVVEAWLAGASGDQERAHQALDDLRRVFPETTDLALAGGGIAQIEIASAEIFPRPAGADGVAVQLLLTATIREDLT